jgi:hypothetical protein
VKESAYEPFAKVIETKVTAFIGEIVTECPNAAKHMGDNNTIFERVPAYN